VSGSDHRQPSVRCNLPLLAKIENQNARSIPRAQFIPAVLTLIKLELRGISIVFEQGTIKLGPVNRITRTLLMDVSKHAAGIAERIQLARWPDYIRRTDSVVIELDTQQPSSRILMTNKYTDYSDSVDEQASFNERTGYLSIKELIVLVPYAEKTVRNLMSVGELVEGQHFFKRLGRVMFSWPAMRAWVEGRESAAAGGIPLVRNRKHGRSS
jgi:hypothetical protein